jgi:phage-related baseplate assembly protein
MSDRFPQIPPPVIIEPDYDGTLKRVKTEYKALTGHYPDTNDPETFLLEELAHERELVVDDINETAQQNLLGYATGDNLDNLGALTETPRLPAAPATTSATITLTDDHPDTTIAAGFEVQADDGVTVFATTDDIDVPAGAVSVDTMLTATTPGEDGNKFLPGEISTPLTQNPYVITVTNTTRAQGGADTEDDDRYARRIWLAPSKFSVAGPYDAYEYFTRSASAAISDVSVWSPYPNDISICAVLEGGVVPDDALQQAILDKCSDKTVRPLGDRVSVVTSQPVSATGDMNIQIYSGAAALADKIQETAAERMTLITNRWRGKLGRDIVPEALEAVVQAIGGVYRAQTTVEYQQLGQDQFPDVSIGQINVTVVDETEL